ncbi:MAG: hypothetical protein M3Q48_03470 [Actinomycetota bacterium]|nr:hypothetical protein [Actinomycetota bacterium]
MRRAIAMVAGAAILALLAVCGEKTDEASRAAGLTPADALALVNVNLDPSLRPGHQPDVPGAAGDRRRPRAGRQRRLPLRAR